MMALQQPSYSLEKFISACAAGKSEAFVTNGAKVTAKSDFNLRTEEAILGFIGQGGMESPAFQNTAIWENNPDPSAPVMVDAYGFFSSSLFGYIAFLYQSRTNKWIVKSLKRNDQPDPRNLALAGPLAAIRDKMFGGNNE